MHTKRVGLIIKRQRYKCRECNETFFEDLPDMDVKRSVTNRLLIWIQETSLEKTFTSVADEIGVDEKTVRNIFNDYVAELEAQTDFRTPKWLGIDEVHLLKNYRCVITDVENKSVIDILRKRNKDTVISHLSNLQDIDKIELVAMDMWNPYKSAVNTVIPHAKIVIDKFHVVKLANEALEKIRKANRQNVSAKERRQLMRDRYVLLTRRDDLNDFDDQIKLQVWTDKFPLLGQAYELKEQFFDIYEAKSIKEGYKLYQNWLSNVPKELMTYFEDLIKSMNNWEKEIFNYFNSPITNAYTESLNRLIKTMNHIGRGYSFEALRAKILFTQGYRKDFEQQLQKGQNPKIKLYVNNINSDGTKNFQLRLSHALYQFQESRDSESNIGIIEEFSTFNKDISMKFYVSIGLLMFAVIYSGMVNTGTLLTREWEERTSKEVSLSPSGFAPLLIAKATTALLLTAVTTILAMILMTFTLKFPITDVSLPIIGWLLVLFLIGASLGAFAGVTIQKSLPVITLSAVIGISLYLLSGNESSIRGFAYGGPIELVWRISSYLPMSYITDTMRLIFVTGKNNLLTSSSNPLTTTTSFYMSMITIPATIFLFGWASIIKLKNNLFSSGGQ